MEDKLSICNILKKNEINFINKNGKFYLNLNKNLNKNLNISKNNNFKEKIIKSWDIYIKNKYKKWKHIHKIYLLDNNSIKVFNNNYNIFVIDKISLTISIKNIFKIQIRIIIKLINNIFKLLNIINKNIINKNIINKNKYIHIYNIIISYVEMLLKDYKGYFKILLEYYKKYIIKENNKNNEYNENSKYFIFFKKINQINEIIKNKNIYKNIS